MYTTDFKELFNKISNCFTLGELIKEVHILQDAKNCIEFDSKKRVWDLIDKIGNHNCIKIKGKNVYVSSKILLKKPTRLLFYLYIAEVEGRLFRILRSNHKISELNTKYIRELGKMIKNSDVIDKQKIYTRSEFYKDLCRISSFRNDVMHITKKFESDIGLLVRRKANIVKMLNSLQQIQDSIDRGV